VTTSIAWVAISAVIGAGAALLTTAGARTVEQPSQPVITRSDEALQHARPSKMATTEVSPERVNALEREVVRLREHGEPLDTPATDIPDPDHARELAAARFSELERRLLAEQVDPSWGSAATGALRRDLSAAAKNSDFALIAAECRTEMCRATLQWNNYDAALMTGMQLPVRAIPGLNCIKTIWLKEPDGRDKPYSADFFLDCSAQRAGTVDTISPTTTGDMP